MQGAGLFSGWLGMLPNGCWVLPKYPPAAAACLWALLDIRFDLINFRGPLLEEGIWLETECLKSSVQLDKSLKDEDSEKEQAIWSTTWLKVTTFLPLSSLLFMAELAEESLLVLLSKPGICKLLEDSLRMIQLDSLWMPFWEVVIVCELLTFSADRAALMTMLSKLTEDKVRLVACGVTNILRIFRRSSSLWDRWFLRSGDSESEMGVIGVC